MAWDSDNPWSHDVYGKESKMNKKHTHKKKPVLKVYKEPYGEKKEPYEELKKRIKKEIGNNFFTQSSLGRPLMRDHI